MLTHLRIIDFALLDDVTLDLGPGLNVLTGETGAGKSLMVDAVSLLRGGRASAEVIRAGAEEARVEAVFSPDPQSLPGQGLAARLRAAGVDPAEEGLVVRRVIGRGRARVYVNGALTTAAVLAELTSDLIDLAGQHEHQTLTDPNRHLAMLDAHAVEPRLLDEMATLHGALTVAAERLAKLSSDERTRGEREDFLRFQLKELDDADPQAGEDERLKQERDRLRAAEKLHAAARRAEGVIYAREGSVVGELGAIVRELVEAGRADPSLGELSRQVDEARVTLEDAADGLRRYADRTHANPAKLEEVEERLHLITKLLRKHGPELSQVIARREAMAAELAALGSYEEQRREAERALDAARADAARAATALSTARRKAAGALGEKVSAALGELGMKGARLQVALGERAAREGDDAALVVDGKRVGPAGWDRAEFLLGANVGEEPRPLQRVASGGELSRIMLALKRVLARTDAVASYVFDEVDAGIGGAVADVVGRQLKSVAADKQVLCVTHLPQIAAYADRHFHVEKRAVGGRTTTVVRRLGHDEQVEELARMVGGAKVTERARAHAEELVKQARTTKPPRAAKA